MTQKVSAYMGGLGIDATNKLEIQANATVTLGGAAGGNVIVGDNGFISFGAGKDLQIYHSGSHSFITDNGDGDLYIRGSDNIRLQVRNSGDTAWTNAIKADDGAATSLMYDGDTKFATTSTGVSITGTLDLGEL